MVTESNQGHLISTFTTRSKLTTYLHGFRDRAERGEAHDVGEVDGDGVEGLGGHLLVPRQPGRHGPSQN